jgi:hypothetical protein
MLSDGESGLSAMRVASVRITAAEVAVVWPRPRIWLRREARLERAGLAGVELSHPAFMEVLDHGLMAVGR